MRKLSNIFLPVMLAGFIISCNSPKEISDHELGEIFHDAMLVNAYIQHNRQKELDSMNIYEPILAKYGYTKEDMHYTLNKITRRKSASLANVADYMISSLSEESDRLGKDVAKHDTINNVVMRRYKQIIYQDSAIVATTEADTSLVQISIPHAQPGHYRIEAEYTLDKKDKGIGRRYFISWMNYDTLVRNISNSPLVSGHRGRIFCDAWIKEEDSMANNLLIDFTRFNLKKHRLKKTPITIHDIKITYSPPVKESHERLFREQSQMRIFSDTMINLKIE